jgi:signal transduction histidine kinase
MRFASWLRRRPLDALVIVLTAAQQLEAWSGSVPGGSLAVSIATAMWTLPLLLRHRFPFAAPAFAFGVQIVSTFLGPDAFAGEDTGFAVILLTFWVAGAYNARTQAVALTAIGFAAIAVVERRDVRIDTDEGITGMVACGVVALIAYVLERRGRRSAALEERATRLAHDREARARDAVAAERARIGRELGGVVAQGLAAMTTRARTARGLLDEDPASARELIVALEESGRQALGELRRLLGILHPSAGEPLLAPTPGMDDLDALVRRAEAAGLPVALTVEGSPAVLAPGVDLAAYRIVQDALTDALEHARPAAAKVAVHYGRDAIALEVSDDGDDGRPGLVSLRERVAVYGGEVEAGRRAGGEYVVRVALPVEAGHA